LAGILDNKTRIMDTLITSEGRRQISSGKLKIEYASFTDRHLFYSSGSSGVLDDQGNRIYFEAYSDDNDKIIIETDGEGNLEPFSSDEYSSYGGKVYASGSGEQVSGSIDAVTSAIFDTCVLNFQRQMIIGTRNLNLYGKEDRFVIAPETSTFFITDETPFNSSSISRATIDDVESVFQDFRLANTLNYRFMPPITRPLAGALTGSVLASYTQLNQDALDTWEEMEEYLDGKQSEEIVFDETSRENNIIGQMFEQYGSSISKLALIDMGSFPIDGRIYPHVYFAGKLYRDSKGSLTFANLFTLVFK